MMTHFWKSISLPLRLAILAVLAAIVLPVAWYLGSPLFINQVVNEPFPAAVAPAQNQPAAAPAQPADAIASIPAPAADQPAAMPAQLADVTTSTAVPAVDQPAAAVPQITEPIALSSGQFGVVDRIHQGEGSATLFKLPDGQRVLRFEQFNVTNGPDLYVYLSGHAAPRDSSQLHEGVAFEVGRLKGNIGDQNYELPGDLDLSQFKSVVIYCRRFSVVFSTAALMEPT